MISSKQQNSLRSKLNYLFDVISITTYGRLINYNWDFNPLWEMDPKENQEIRSMHASECEAYYRLGVLTPDMIAEDLQNRGWFNIPDDYIDALRTLEPDDDGTEQL
jgi:hypothetical protein